MFFAVGKGSDGELYVDHDPMDLRLKAVMEEPLSDEVRAKMSVKDFDIEQLKRSAQIVGCEPIELYQHAVRNAKAAVKRLKRSRRKMWDGLLQRGAESPKKEEAMSTPGAKWREDGESDPHGDRYDCPREQTAMGDMTDDQLANAVFMHGNEPLDLEGILAGRKKSSIAWLTAAKDRIRWLSRQLTKKDRRIAELEDVLRSVQQELHAQSERLPEGFNTKIIDWVDDAIGKR